MNNEIIYEEASPGDIAKVEQFRKMLLPSKGKSKVSAAEDLFDNAIKMVPAWSGGEVEFHSASFGGIFGQFHIPSEGDDKSKIILFIHGGGFVHGKAESFINTVSNIAGPTKLPCFIVGYRLAPQHPFPAALDDSFQAYKGLQAEYGSVAILAESAGTNLALGVTAKCAQESIRLPAAISLVSSFIDLTLSGESMLTRAEADPLFTKDTIQEFVIKYIGDDNIATDPFISPLNLDYSKITMPPVRIDVGAHEVLLSDSTRLYDALVKNNRKVSLIIWQDVFHSFPFRALPLDAKKKALQQINAFLVDSLS